MSRPFRQKLSCFLLLLVCSLSLLRISGVLSPFAAKPVVLSEEASLGQEPSSGTSLSSGAGSSSYSSAGEKGDLPLSDNDGIPFGGEENTVLSEQGKIPGETREEDSLAASFPGDETGSPPSLVRETSEKPTGQNGSSEILSVFTDTAEPRETSPTSSDSSPSHETEEVSRHSGNPANLKEAQALFSPALLTEEAGVSADNLISYLKKQDGTYTRGEENSLKYAAGDCYELSPLKEGLSPLATLYYYYPTGASDSRGDTVYDEALELPRLKAAIRHLFPEQYEEVFNDFTVMRHWTETWLSLTGKEEPDWSFYSRSRYYGTRYLLFTVYFDAVTLTIYPEDYSDSLGDFAPPGSYRDFYGYPLY